MQLVLFWGDWCHGAKMAALLREPCLGKLGELGGGGARLARLSQRARTLRSLGP